MTRKEMINYLIRHTSNTTDDLNLLSDEGLSRAVQIINQQIEQELTELTFA
ncbi:hypothetical protein [Lentilactobacillus sp. SPB1-3]|uniref:Uncharacterized protein n=1 Tax=Lentilactobacillus terminaliae TaxID=3003483 RepID=A0ACD5DCN6_9LACO|nr:hypothetical protein [Lentilactobacillus sp. SPB1-3]MCZ0978051.1 hypothetical protein [Lentilactobacillus sp. SPB1-3]